jgi:hypothetical protein
VIRKVYLIVIKRECVTKLLIKPSNNPNGVSSVIKHVTIYWKKNFLQAFNASDRYT